MARWDHIKHDTHIGLCGIGATPAQALEQTALAMSAAITDLDAIRPLVKIEVSCMARALDTLLFDWLNLLVYEMTVGKMLFSRFSVDIAGGRLFGLAWGEKVDLERHRPATAIKAATRTALDVKQYANGEWVAQCVVDVLALPAVALSARLPRFQPKGSGQLLG